jgi:hypothetical protein
MPLLRVETRSAVPWAGFRILNPKAVSGVPAAIRSAVIPVKMELHIGCFTAKTVLDSGPVP